MFIVSTFSLNLLFNKIIYLLFKIVFFLIFINICGEIFFKNGAGSFNYEE